MSRYSSAYSSGSYERPEQTVSTIMDNLSKVRAAVCCRENFVLKCFYPDNICSYNRVLIFCFIGLP